MLKDFTHRVRIDNDTPEIYQWCVDNLSFGTWGKLLPLIGHTATYCFEREDDAVMFKINYGYK